MSFQSAADDLAANLPGSWRVEHRYEHLAILLREDGMELRLYSKGWRVELAPAMPAITGQYHHPKDFGAEEDEPRVTFDLRRMEGKPVRVAAEAHRRVVEKWDPLWRRCCARRDERLAERGDAEDIARRLAEILGAELYDGPLADGRDARLRTNVAGMFGSVRISAYKGGNVTMQLESIPGWAAIRIAEALAALPKPNR